MFIRAAGTEDGAVMDGKPPTTISERVRAIAVVKIDSEVVEGLMINSSDSFPQKTTGLPR